MSSNQLTSSRSMNGIISIYSQDIAVDTIDANEITVDDLTINNSLEVNNITLSPETISFLDGATSNIQDQIDNIANVQGDYVTLDTTQQITGNKVFSGTTTFIGDIDVSNTLIKPYELSYSSGLIGNIQEQINQIDPAISGMTLNTDQTATGFKIFLNGIQSPFIQNSDNTGWINGFLLDLDTILFSSYSGTWNTTTNPSKVSGGNVTGKTLLDLDPAIPPYNEATIETNDQLQPVKKSTTGYIPSTDTFYLKDITNIQLLNGIVFDTTNDFVNTINGNEITLLLNTGYTPTITARVGSIIQVGTDYYVNTSDTYTLNGFIECVNTTPLTQILTNTSSNLYPLYYTTTPTETTNTTINNFNYNNKLYTDSVATDYTGKYAVDNLNIPYGSKLSVGSDNSVYTFSINPSNQISIDDLNGFYDGGLFIIENTITNPSTKSVLLQNTDEHGFISSVSANNEVILTFNNFQTTISATNHSYVKNLTGTPFMVCETNRVGYYSNHSTILYVESRIGDTNSYLITSPNTIVADTPNTITVNYYLPNSTTIIFQTSTPFIIGDFYEIGSNYGYRIQSITTANYIYGTINSQSVNTKNDLLGVIVENVTGGSYDGTYSFLYGSSSSPSLNSPIVNTTYAPQNYICYISTNTRTNQTNSFGFTQTFNTVVPSPKRENKSFKYIVNGIGEYIFDCDNTSSIQINDIVQYLNDGDNVRTGKYIYGIKFDGINSTCLKRYQGLYNESATTYYQLLTGTSDNLRYFGYNNLTPYFLVSTSKFTGTQPSVGDFIYFDLLGNGVLSYTYITSISIQTNQYLMYVNFAYNNNIYGLTAQFFQPAHETILGFDVPKLYNIFPRITYDKYTFYDSIDKYSQTNKFYPPQTYNLFQNTTTKLYDEITINEFPVIDFDIYQNYQYNFQTTTNINLPAVSFTDTFVARRFAQTLFEKTIGDNLTIQGGLTITGENDFGNLLVQAGANPTAGNITAEGDIQGTDITATGNISCVDLTATGKVNTNRIENNYQVATYINGSSKFYVGDGITQLISKDGSVLDIMANTDNLYMEFTPNGTIDFACRITVNKRGQTSGGRGDFFLEGYRFSHYYLGTRQIYFGYLNSTESLLMGRSDATYIRFNSNTEIYYHVNNASRFTMASNGYHYATLHVNTSDKRLKNNIVDVSNALQTLNTLEVKEFDKKCSLECDECCEETSHEIGFIAQQVEQTDLSFCVATSQQNDTKGLKDSCIYALNVKATQELYAMVLKQQEEINSLKERLSYLNI